jgi:hypothetical protein
MGLCAGIVGLAIDLLVVIHVNILQSLLAEGGSFFKSRWPLEMPVDVRLDLPQAQPHTSARL